MLSIHTLAGVNVATFAVQHIPAWSQPEQLFHNNMMRHHFAIHRQYSPTRQLTSGFLHVNGDHIGGNIVMLYIFGTGLIDDLKKLNVKSVGEGRGGTRATILYIIPHPVAIETSRLYNSHMSPREFDNYGASAGVSGIIAGSLLTSKYMVEKVSIVSYFACQLYLLYHQHNSYNPTVTSSPLPLPSIRLIYQLTHQTIH